MKTKIHILKNRILILTAVVFIAGFSIFAVKDDFYEEVSKSYDIYTAILKDITTNYVDEVPVGILLKSSLEGMLAELDPYSVYIDEDEKESVEIISTGKYTGLGMTVGNIDNKLYVTDILEGMPAQEAGLKIGDILFIIDKDTVLSLKSKDLKPYTSGQQGTFADVIALREKENNGKIVFDTVNLKIKRDFIKVKNINTFTILQDSIGYIELTRFTRDAAKEFKDAVLELKSKNINNLVIDLRNNPGGLLEGAVGITELFVEEGSEIVSTRGRTKRSQYSYKSKTPPIAKDMKLTILINQYSASASEVVAGALQDYDRGVLIGKRSFGKGLVQSIFNLPHNKTLKLTTSKYYTPSGRCIQKIDYSKVNRYSDDEEYYDENEENDEIEQNIENTRKKIDPQEKNAIQYFTKNGRKVSEQTGISPDIYVNEKETSDFVNNIESNGFFFLYANKLMIKINNDVTKLNSPKFWESNLKNFKDYLVEVKFISKSKEMELIKSLDNELKKDYSEGVKMEMSLLENLIKNEFYNKFESNKKDIISKLKFEVYKRLKNDELRNELLLEDEFISTALKNFITEKYNKTLAKDKSENNKDNH